MNIAHKILVDKLNKVISPIDDKFYNNLMDKIGDARFVLLGEATHGTHEFYQTRIEISKKLIEEKGFMAIAIEGDWPDVYRMHRYIQHKSKDNEFTALDDFKRFPIWLWRNNTIPPFLKWLFSYNQKSKFKIGIYGLDLYSLNISIESVIKYLKKVDPFAARDAIKHYSCFDHVSTDPQMYGYLTSNHLKKSCIQEVSTALKEIQHDAFKYLHTDGLDAQEEYFFATQNARVVKNAEAYYKSMYEGHVESWNIRDSHMNETLNVLIDHLENIYNKPAKIIVWAHNSHLGDARATEMGEKGELNLGQLIREQHEKTYSIGFSTYEGTVRAANNWDEVEEEKIITPGFLESYEALFHDLNHKNFILDFYDENIEHLLSIPRLQRAIGVIYRPETERYSHYFFTRLPYQFDSIIHIDKTQAVGI